MLRFAFALFLLAGVAVSQAQVQPETSRRVAEAMKLQQKGLSAQAKQEFEAALPQLRILAPSPELGQTLNGLSQLSAATGNYDAAVSLAREGATAFGAIHDSSGEARSWNNAGVAHLFAGMYSAAAEEFDRAVRLAGAARDAKTEVQALNNLGSVALYQARYTNAFAEYSTAMQRLAEYPNADWHNYWRQITLFNQATLYQRLGDEQHALDTYREIQSHPTGLLPADQAHLYANLGTVYRRLGDPIKALSSYREAQRFFLREKDTDGEIGVLKNIGIVQALDLNHPADALRSFDAALRIAEKIKNQREALQARLYRGETLYRMQRFEAALQEFRAALEKARSLGTAEEQWKALYALGRSFEATRDTTAAENNYGDAVTVIESLRSKLQLGSLRAEFLADKRDPYDGLIRLLLARKDVPGAFQFLERSRSRNFQDRLQGVNAGSALELKQVQSRLRDGVVLLEFWTAGNRIAVIWVTAKSAGSVESVLSSAQFEYLAHDLSRLPETLDDAYASNGALVPIQKLLGDIPVLQNLDAGRVIVVPDGIFSALPFEALRIGRGRMLIETAEVSYLPSARVLLRASTAGKSWNWPWQEQLVAFGDPVMAKGNDSGLQLTTAGGQGLPHTRLEVESAARLCSGRTELHLGPANSKIAFLRDKLDRAPILHISTHGVSDAERPERSRLLFSPATSDGDNDYLFLREMYDLDFRGVDLVALSACDTERGRLVRGEGVQGFSRAIVGSGARAAVTTLWQVADQSTAEFMRQFYFRLLKKGDTKAAALRQAKLKFIQSGQPLRNPRYWAAFVLYGDGDTPVPTFISWQVLGMAGSALVVFLALAAWSLVRGRRSRQAPGPQTQRPNQQATQASG